MGGRISACKWMITSKSDYVLTLVRVDAIKKKLNANENKASNNVHSD